MIIVTGGAGFIGSALVWGLNKRGRSDILIVDEIDHDEKEHNVAVLQYKELISGQEFREKLAQGDYDSKGVEAILHMGAISATTENSWEKLRDTNVDFSQEVIRWCADKDVRCVYASSAGVYGGGELGYSDSEELFDELKTITLYGKSKLTVDIWARDGGYLDSVVGLRFFNAFGPNEWHKGEMRSVMAKKYSDVAAGKPMQLFKSENPLYPNGGQKRDFVYVKDVVDVVLFFLDTKAAGVFNVGTGEARTWNEVAHAMFKATGQETKIEYVPMPEHLRGHYQEFTQADIRKLREAGYKKQFMTVAEAIDDYVKNYLGSHQHLGA